MAHAQVHRFHDCVAVYLEDGKTVYIRPGDAKKLAAALNKCAKDIVTNKFLSSTFRTTEMNFVDNGHNGTDYTQKREG